MRVNTYYPKNFHNLAFKEGIKSHERFYKINGENTSARDSLPFKKFGTNKIGYSFDVNDCKYSFLKAINYASLKNYIEFYKEEFNTTHPEKNIEKIEYLFSNNKNIKFQSETDYFNIKQLNDRNINVIKGFFDNLECFINAKFDEVGSFERGLNKAQYSISLCATPDKFLFKIGACGIERACSDTNFLPPHNFHESLILYDGIVRFNSPVPQVATIHTLKHEILHALGLDHVPFYKSLEENLRYRSLLEQDGVDETTGKSNPLEQQCNEKYFSRGKEHIFFATIKEWVECLSLPKDITPTDLYSLFQIFGFSQNESETCQGLRQVFIEKYEDYFVFDTLPYDDILENTDIL